MYVYETVEVCGRVTLLNIKTSTMAENQVEPDSTTGDLSNLHRSDSLETITLDEIYCITCLGQPLDIALMTDFVNTTSNTFYLDRSTCFLPILVCRFCREIKHLHCHLDRPLGLTQDDVQETLDNSLPYMCRSCYENEMMLN